MTTKKTATKTTSKTTSKPKKLSVKDVSKLSAGASAGCTGSLTYPTCSGPNSSTGTQGANCPGCSVVGIKSTAKKSL